MPHLRQQCPTAPARTLPTAAAISCLTFALLAIGNSPCEADWPQFRGPNCSGISRDTEPLPASFSQKENFAWSAELGDGIGSPVIAAGRVFVSAMTAPEEVGLFAFDLASGKQLWKRSWKTGPLPEVHKTNSHASTTPAADEQRCYFYFSSLGMLAVDAATGNDVWQHKLPAPFFVFKWGPGMSPVLYRDKLLFCQDDDLYPAVYAFDKRTGKVHWTDQRREMAVNYSHPVICSTKQGDEIVIGGTGMLIGYAPESGQRLWTARTLLRNIKTTPVVERGVIYLSLQSSGIANQWLATADRSETGNSDGKLTKQEMQAFVGETKIPDAFFARTFDRGDANGDGYLEGEELDRAFLHPDNFAGARYDVDDPADEFILAVRGGGRGDVTESHVSWKHPTKYTDHIVSPLISQERMFLIKSGGITTVFDTRHGKPLRGAKRIANACDYFASPIIGDGKIYLAGENGIVAVLEDAADYPLVAKNDLGDSIVATPAIAKGNLVVRTRKQIMCFRVTDG